MDKRGVGDMGKPGFAGYLRAFLAAIASAAVALPAHAFAQNATPKDFKIAFLGDQGLGPNPEAVLRLVKSEGAKLLVHLGDFDYHDHPSAWEGQTDKILGADFPQFSVMGNHDEAKWPSDTGYGEKIRSRMAKQGITDAVGTFGKQCSFHYKGIFFVFTTPGLDGTGHDAFIRNQLAADNSIWRISAWHVDQKLMQVGGKGDEAGWPVYEASREGGAIIATAHEHLYCRTHLLSSMTNQTVASKDSILKIAKGKTFAFVQGLGGAESRPQLLSGDWWAKVYTQTQGAQPGALFATFNAGGIANRADFYFKDIQGRVPDQFTVLSQLGPVVALSPVEGGRLAVRPGAGPAGRQPDAVWDLRGKRVPLDRSAAGGMVMEKRAVRPGIVLVGKGTGKQGAVMRVVLP